MISNLKQPLVSVGMPVYDRPNLLRCALESLTKQTYKNLELIISDDCSPGEGTANVVHDFMRTDRRIRYYRQERNLGHFANHRFVFEKAKGEYFFWANEDDEWDERYFEKGIQALLDNPDFDAWMCTITNTDSFGRVNCHYPGFSRFTSTNNRIADLVRYLWEPEIMGKAHVFHSIFRKSSLDTVVSEYFITEAWGSDMCFGSLFLTHYKLLATDEVLFHKRVIRPSDNPTVLNPIVIQEPSRHIFSLEKSLDYIREYYHALRSTPYKYLALTVLFLRMPIAIRNDAFSIQAIKTLLYKIARKTKRLLLATGNPFLYDLFWHQKFGYKHDPMTIDTRWSLVNTDGVIRVPLNLVRAPIHTIEGIRFVPVEETPHCKWIRSLVMGSDDACLRDKYREYLEAYYPEEDTAAGLDHVVALVSSFQSGANRDSLITIVTHPPTLYKGSDYIVVYDGVHRSAIAKALGHEFVRCRLVSSRINSHDFASRILNGQSTGLS